MTSVKYAKNTKLAANAFTYCWIWQTDGNAIESATPDVTHLLIQFSNAMNEAVIPATCQKLICLK